MKKASHSNIDFKNKRNQSIVVLALIYAGLVLWNIQATSSIELGQIAWLITLVFGVYIIGDNIVFAILNQDEEFNNIQSKILIGIICSNFLLLISGYIFNTSLRTIWYFLLVLSSSYWIYKKIFINKIEYIYSKEYLYIIFIIILITIWCSDILRPLIIQDDVTIIHAWHDSYYHISLINNFSKTLNFLNLSDVQVANANAHPYHLASYLLPATYVNSTGISAFSAFQSLFIPLGLLCTALGAYTLARVVFGKVSAYVASVSLILLPDSTQQGFSNYFFGYHQIQQLAPAQGYGIGCAAIVFSLLFHAYKRNEFKYIFISYFFLILTLLYKAQIFVSISYLALIFPIMFIGSYKLINRVQILFIATLFYLVVMHLSQYMPSVPVLKINGSGLFAYSQMILNLQSEGVIRYYLLELYKWSEESFQKRALVFDIYVIFISFGIYPLIYLLSLFIKKEKNIAINIIFIVLVILNYLFIINFFALDTRLIGMPEEIHHRPFVWVYFCIVVWMSASIYIKLNENKKIYIFSVLIFIYVPIIYSQGIQAFNVWGVDYKKFDSCKIMTALYIKNNSEKNDIFLDSELDTDFMISAISERQSFLTNSGGYRKPVGFSEKLNLTKEIKYLETTNSLKLFMLKNNIKWYIAHPKEGMIINTDNLIYECNGYKLYKF